MISVILLGAGNVGTHLYKAFSKAKDVKVVQWYNRELSGMQMFKNEVELIDGLPQLKEADIYIMAVSDDAIAKLSEALPFNDRLVVHTSGSVNMHDLDKKLQRGVFYPLQTFSKASDIDFKHVPICLEVKEKQNMSMLKNLAEAIGSPHYKIYTEQRQALHLAAVYINNFVNQLYRVAHEISDSNGVEFDILKPLILETARKVQDMSPYMAQTGPAKRNDKKTIKRHLKQLENEQHKAIYELLTRSIKSTHGR